MPLRVVLSRAAESIGFYWVVLRLSRSPRVKGLRSRALGVASPFVRWRLRRAGDVVWNRAGVALALDARDRRAQRLYLEGGTLSHGLVGLWDEIVTRERPAIIVDVGANYGEIAFCRRYPWRPLIHLFEPNASVARCLRASVSINRIPNAFVYEVLVGDVRDTRRLYLSAESSGLSSMSDTGNSIASVERVMVPIDDVVKAGPEDTVLVKLDVEGHELAALAGMMDLVADSSRLTCICEIGHLSARDLVDLFRRFEIWLVDGRSSAEVRCTPAMLQEFVAGRLDRHFLGDAVLRPKK